MKILFVEAKTKSGAIDFSVFKNLPKNLAIAYSIQYKNLAESIFHFLKKTHNIKEFSQVLGCSRVKFKDKAILLIGSGRFHALNLLLQGYEVFIYNNSTISKIDDELEKFKTQRKSALLNFLSSKEKAVLVSIKPGQYNLKKALKLGEKYKASIFLADNINIAELENFSPQSWINTACPTLIYDSIKLINPEEV